jgi:glucose-1-phosphate cytidylyltransferase
MKVVILCGGKGTRLKERTESIPKPLIEIGGRPILWHIMKIYAAHGFSDFILCLGYKGQAIKEYFMDYLSWRHHDFSLDLSGKEPSIHLLNHDREQWKITFADTGEETNTGGRVKQIAPLVGGEDSFMVTYGDGVADVNINKLCQFHRCHGKLGTITVVNPTLQFGLLDVGNDNGVSRFREKPLLDQWINGGFFVFRRGFFDYLNEDDILERAPLERLSKDGQLMAFRHETYWECMDTYKDTTLLNELWATGKAPWKIW